MAESRFYIAGGTLPLVAPSYVTRRADQELYAALKEGRFCYVLTSRQMGKSSLMGRAASRLRAEGVAVAEIDLTGVGHNLTTEQWYDGLVYELGRELGLKRELRECWRSQPELGPLQRFLHVLRHGVLELLDCPVVLFVDEIEVVRSLPFSTDEFFAAIRECYNRRTADPAMGRLSFCLLGMATPTDLIRDARITPFNIGQRIDLTDFTPEEAAPLALGLERPPALSARLLKRVLHWTGGQPYLTQRLCQAIADDPGIRGERGVDAACRELFTSPRAREVDINLVPIREYLLHCAEDAAALLNVYARVLARKRVESADTDRNVALLRLSGVTRVRDGCLVLRNRIYAHVFDRQWVERSMPDAERRRQRAAYRQGLLRATAVYGAALAVMGGLGVRAYRAEQKATEERDAANHLLCLYSINMAKQAYDDRNIAQAESLLQAPCFRAEPASARRFEWRYVWSLCHQEARGYDAGRRPLMAVAAAPDGHVVAVASDGGVLEWPQDGTAVVQRLGARSEDVRSAAVSPDGKYAAFGGLTGGIALWDTRAGRQIASLQGPRRLVGSLAFSADGDRLASGAYDGSVAIWDCATGRLVRILRGARGRVLAVALAPDGARAAAGMSDGTVTVWDVTTGRSTRSIAGRWGKVFAVALQPGGTAVAFGGRDSRIRLGDLRTGAVRTLAAKHTRKILAVAFSPDGSTLAAGSADTCATVWDVRSGALMREVRGHTDDVLALCVLPRGLGLLTASADGTARLWTADPLPSVALAASRNPDPPAFAISGASYRVASQTVGGPIRVTDSSTGREVARVSCRLAERCALACSPDGRTLAAAGRGGAVCLYDLPSGRPVRSFGAGGEDIFAAAFSPSGQVLATGDAVGTVRLSDAATGRPLRSIRTHRDSINQLAFSRDGMELAVGNSGATVAVCNVATGRMRQIHVRGSHGATALALSPEGRLLASAVGRTIEIADCATGRTLRVFTAHSTQVTAVDFSPDGLTVATGGDDDTVRLWDAATDQQTLALPAEAACAVAFSQNGCALAGIGTDRRLRMWWASPREPEAAQPVAPAPALTASAAMTEPTRGVRP